jgi:hypothetical protein
MKTDDFSISNLVVQLALGMVVGAVLAMGFENDTLLNPVHGLIAGMIVGLAQAILMSFIYEQLYLGVLLVILGQGLCLFLIGGEGFTAGLLLGLVQGGAVAHVMSFRRIFRLGVSAVSGSAGGAIQWIIISSELLYKIVSKLIFYRETTPKKSISTNKQSQTFKFVKDFEDLSHFADKIMTKSGSRCYRDYLANEWYPYVEFVLLYRETKEEQYKDAYENILRSAYKRFFVDLVAFSVIDIRRKLFGKQRKTR